MTLSQAITYLPFWLAGSLSFILGACVGSFLNVIIYRIPIGPEKRNAGIAFNINTPRSHCPVCQHQLAWYENVPLLSWTLQAAKCKNCKTTIPARYPAIELFVATVSATTWYFNESWQLVLFSLMLCMTFIPTTWWVATQTKWNKFMLSWLLIDFFASMAFGGYSWTIK